MTPEQEMLEIERERLKMERQRDRHASIRFIVGTVLLAAATTGASLYISEKQANRMLINDQKQANRMLINDQKQLVIPMLMKAEPKDFNKVVSIIDDFIENAELEPEVVSLLKARRVKTLQQKRDYEEKLAAENAAKEEEERLKQIALEEKRKAKAIVEAKAKKEAEEKARIAKEKQIAAAKASEKAKKETEAVLREIQHDRMLRMGVF
ncbi:MAG: hypothetical protein JAY84_00830 [Candidatus Thiodiazotropha taylori]|nr:hypothetical protein [Candidatus Thiodiazotropha taylori]